MEHPDPGKSLNRAIVSLKMLGILLLVVILPGIWLIISPYLKISGKNNAVPEATLIPTNADLTNLWTAPDEWRMMKLEPEEQERIKYGKDLIAHTSRYLGPKGIVSKISNGMNCQNCHLNAGTQPWGNNYFAVQATYPKFRERSGTTENQVKRVNDCLQRSLNGQALDSTSREMKSILAYLKWIGSDVTRNKIPRGSGIYKLEPLDTAADPGKGRLVYQARCQSCHQENGEGVLAMDKKEYIYPPLWGIHSYNTGAGLFRLSGFAGYVKMNMPFGVTYQKPLLSDEEAWHVAAYVNSMPRPVKDLSGDWPDISGKPFDHPFGPYADPFPEEQHKYGPFKPIRYWIKKNKKVKNAIITKS